MYCLQTVDLERKCNLMKMRFCRNVFLVFLFAFFMEVVVFNWDMVKTYIEPEKKLSVVFTLDDLELLNWEETEGGYISRSDPIIYKSGINTEIENISFMYIPDQEIQNVTIFCINEEYPVPSVENMITFSKVKVNQKLSINKMAQDIRIDLGEKEGLKLQQFTMKINSAEWSISMARIIAIVLIYVFSVMLFRLQKSPDYEI